MLFLILHSSIILIAQPGSPDSTFGVNGKVTEYVPDYGGFTAKVAIQTDNKIVIGSNFGSHGFSVIRFTLEGERDSTFGINGIGFFVLGALNAMAIQSDDKIVCTGYTFMGNTTDFAIGRFTSEGLPDSSFGTVGFITTSMGPANDNAWCVAIQPDMKIIVAGTSYNSITQKDDFAAVRYHSNGDVDSTFGSNGKVVLSIGDYCYDICTSISVQPDGKIVLIGGSCPVPDTLPSGNSGSSLVRLNADGTPDPSFGNGGIVVTTNEIGPWAAALQDDGKIILGGAYHHPVIWTTDFALTRFNPNGTPDGTFGNNGVTMTVFDSLNTAGINSLSIQTNGKIIAGGAAAIHYVNGDNQYAFALTCYNHDGLLDTTFGNNGKVLTTFSPESENSDGALSGLIQRDNKILLAGYHYMGILYPTYVALARYISDLNVGIITTNSPVKSFLIYPNPIHEYVSCKFELSRPDIISINLYDLHGNKIKQFFSNVPRSIGQYVEPLRFDEVIPSGLYILSIESGSGRYNIKITKY
jgi:uncharacterized delta-60 repeat protein